MRVRLPFLVSILTAIGFAQAAGAVPNPVYQSWAGHQPGTAVTMKSVTEASGMRQEMEQVYTLKSVSPEKVTIEIAVSMMVMGNRTTLPAHSMDIPAEQATDPAAPTGIETTTTDETITVGGKEYRTRCTTVTSNQNGTRSTSKTWNTSDVPNMVVKMEVKSEGTMASTVASEVTKIELK